MPDHPKTVRTNVNTPAAKLTNDQQMQAARAVASPPRQISSEVLFAGAREITIEHNGRHYRLRITQFGKLILTA